MSRHEFETAVFDGLVKTDTRLKMWYDLPMSTRVSDGHGGFKRVYSPHPQRHLGIGPHQSSPSPSESKEQLLTTETSEAIETAEIKPSNDSPTEE